MINYFFAIDVGNTEIVISLIKNFRIYRINRLKTKDFKKKNYLLFKSFLNFNKILKLEKNIVSVISSVVPEINFALKKTCESFLKTKPFLITYKNSKLNIKINFDKKSQIGADRLVNTVAVKSLYKYPALVIDFGTATTFDVIDNNGNYSGGLITPGINLSLENLYKKTSMLPHVKFVRKNELIGKNTKNAIENGVYWGYVGLVSFIIKKVQSKFKKKLYCISTGGMSKIISKDIKSINKIDQNLTIKGIIEIFKLNYFGK